MFKKKDKFLTWITGAEEELVYIAPAKLDDAHYNAIVKQLVKHNYIFCGDTHQSQMFKCVPLFRDGYIEVSMRVWGAIMADARNIKEKTDKYTYLDFNMACTCPLIEKLPR
jgi:hypothetical protein